MESVQHCMLVRFYIVSDAVVIHQRACFQSCLCAITYVNMYSAAYVPTHDFNTSIAFMYCC